MLLLDGDEEMQVQCQQQIDGELLFEITEAENNMFRGEQQIDIGKILEVVHYRQILQTFIYIHSQ